MLQTFLSNPLHVIAAVIVIVFGVGRMARIVTYDDFPPSIAVRIWWGKVTKDGKWAKLANCFWCATPWIMLVSMGWFALGFVLTWVAWAWWIFWGWLALSYIASIVIARDEPRDN